MISHLLLPRARKTHLLTLISERLKRMAALLARSSGPDATRLGRGLAAGRVVKSQLRRLPELSACKLDCRYGNAGTCIGATAAVLTAIGILVNCNNADWFRRRAALLSALVRTEGHLTDWCSRGTDVDAAAVLACECRAIARSIRAVEVAILISAESGLDAIQSMRLQLSAAQKAAFAPTYLSLHSQTDVLETIERRELVFDEEPPPVAPAPPAQQAGDFVPLSELVIPTRACESSSSGSSSGVVSSISSSGASEFEAVEMGFETTDWLDGQLAKTETGGRERSVDFGQRI